jgi:uncharacterized protein YqhQ
MARFSYGGQALIEGVLMRGRDAVAVAIRHPDGSIVAATEGLDSPLHRSRYGRLPFVRGLIVLYDTLVVGFRWLTRSANVAASGQGVELGKGSVAIMLVVALGLGVGIFLILPLLLAQLTIRGLLAEFIAPLSGGSPLIEHFLEGALRLTIFVGYLLIISRSPEVKRVFRYHGAEHMTIHALEHGDPLTSDAVRRYPTAHPRCGTEFILVVVVVSIFAFSLLAGQSLLVSVGGRIALLPVIAAVSYELLRFGARHRANPIVRAVFMPGIWLQMITTAQPDDDMIDVAIVSMAEALEADGEWVPEGSDVAPSRPFDFGIAAERPLVGSGTGALAIDEPAPSTLLAGEPALASVPIADPLPAVADSTAE